MKIKINFKNMASFMNKNWLIFVILMAIPFSVLSVRKKDINDVNTALKEIKNTPSGMNLLELFKTCGVSINYETSFISKMDHDIPDRGFKNGDKVLDILFNLETPSWDTRPEIYQDLVARWVFRNNQIIPASGWAENFQNEKKPISWQECP